MNRYLSIPLVLAFAGFAATYFSQTSYGEPIVVAVSTPIVNSVHPVAPNAEPISFKDVQTMILDEWPTLGVSHFASRMAPRQPLYAHMGPTATFGIGRSTRTIRGYEAPATPDPEAEEFFCSLFVAARPLPNKATKKEADFNWHQSDGYAIHVDRYTKEIKIFADQKWQTYASWKKAALPKYKELTGWNAQTEKAGLGMDGQ